MVRYGRILLQHQPEESTELLIDLCSGNLGKTPTHNHAPTTTDGKDKATNGSGAGTGPAMLSYLGYNRVTGFLTGDNQSTTTSNGGPSTQANGRVSQGEEPNGTDKEPATQQAPSYTPPSPQQYFAHFLDQPIMFIHFLESVALELWNQRVDAVPRSHDTALPIREEAPPSYDDDPVKADKRAVWNTLLELYLTSTRSNEGSTATEASDKALGLLANTELPYDPMHALILCSSADFKEGLVRLWESMGMYEDVLRFYMDKDRDTDQVNGRSNTDSVSPSTQVLRYLDLYGPTNPHLYPLVLRYLSSSPDILSRHPDKLAAILQTIDEERIMPPLAIIQLMSRNGVTSVGSVKEWLRQKTVDTRDDISAVGCFYTRSNESTDVQDKSLIESYRSETASKEKQIVELSDTAHPEVFQVTRCTACGGQLDLPSVHFMCKHSYHQRSATCPLYRE
jgi:hypothetical protein